MTAGLRRLRDMPGVLVKDLARYRRALARSGRGHECDPGGWIALCNRNEKLLRVPGEKGVACDWEWGSTLHAPQILPFLGKRIMAAAFEEWPVEWMQRPRIPPRDPRVSFIFTHAGKDRLPQLLRTIASVNSQRDIACECIVVDQSPQSIQELLPAHVRHIRLCNDGLGVGWRKAWGFNVGARAAVTGILVFHDGDICVPTRYASELVDAIESRGHAAVSLQRLLFYLDPEFSSTVGNENVGCIEAIRQNWKGGTIAIRKDAFIAIGGFDEGFVDWGGEDDEFYDRCATVGHCRSGYLPFLHLWHAPQTGRKQAVNPNVAKVLPWRLAMDRKTRSRELAQRRFGYMDTPDPARGYLALESFTTGASP